MCAVRAAGHVGESAGWESGSNFTASCVELSHNGLVVRCAALHPQRLRGDQLLPQDVYMFGAEIMILRTEALHRSDHVIGDVDKGI